MIAQKSRPIKSMKSEPPAVAGGLRFTSIVYSAKTHLLAADGSDLSEGGKSYPENLSNTEMHRLDAGYFAIEDHSDYIS